VRRTVAAFILMLLVPVWFASPAGARTLAGHDLRPTPRSSLVAAPYVSSVSELPAGVRELMIGSSWRPGCPVALRDLRLVRVTFWGFDATAHPGKLVVHRWYADEFERVFRVLYRERFPIRRMELVDRYGADDMRSMRADNTSAFNCRYRSGVCCTWSMHAYGKAIDINPVENPYVGPWGVSPPNGADYVDRTPLRKGMIGLRGDVWWAFHAIGWEWGGTWTSTKDYQHFSSNGR
jgi:D-alanyl-D-alanine carboxypeptidase